MQPTERGDYLMLSVPQMDHEHLELFAREDEFSAAVDAEASRAELEMRLTQLIEGFQKHFDSEESLMRTNSFPGLELHIDEHRKLLGQMSGLRDDLSSGVVNRCYALAQFVRLWTEHHMTGADTNFARFLHHGKARQDH
ncbi:MAG: hemerythrin family protein [Candidatus Solibacter sp.]|nr:hemerythrin family protein [Candidatus Solibacter sp.]